MNKTNKRILIVCICTLLLCLIIYAFFRISNQYKINVLFAHNASKMQENLENPIFKLEKVIVYSDANIEDLSENQNLEDINISQFTDFAIYIDNNPKVQELTEENTVNKIYIDNISVTGTDLGTQKVFYKDINKLCNYEPIREGASLINYIVLHANREKEIAKMSNVYYTDCSEPLIVTYVNENIIERKDASESKNKLSLDGSMLRYFGIKLEDLNYRISFRINLENNLGELYYCDFSQDVNLNSSDGGIYTGYIMQVFDLSDSKYIFRKL